MIFAWAMRMRHGATAPADPGWNDRLPFFSLFMMDGQIIIEPDLGIRAAQSMVTTEKMRKNCWGQELST